MYTSPATLVAAQAELKRRLGDQKYSGLMRPGQLPPLTYRDAPRSTNTPTEE